MSMRHLLGLGCFLLAASLCAQANSPRLSLNEAVRLALAQNKSVKVDAYNRPIARANLLAARGIFDPALTFERSYSEDGSPERANPVTTQLSQSDDYRLSLDGLLPWGMSYSLGTSAQNRRGTFNGFTDNFSTFNGLTVTQPLLRGFGFGANLYGVRVAKADQAISDWEFRQTLIDTVTRVVIAYSDLVFAHENLRIIRQARGLVERLVDDNEKRFSSGLMSENDVTQARAQAAQRGEAIVFAERAVRDNDNALRRLLGEESFSLQGALLAVEVPRVSEPVVTLADDVKKALELRPDYQSALLGLTKVRAGEKFSRNQLLPRVDLVGSYGYSGLDREFSASRRMAANGDYRSYSAGIVVSVPLAFAEGRGRARASRLSSLQAEADVDRFAQEIALLVANAAGQIETTRERVKTTRSAFELASKALAGEQKKLQAGTTTTFVVLNLQTQLANIESNLARALADQRRAWANYERELGITLKTHAITIADMPR
jgi:outer membrane protein